MTKCVKTPSQLICPATSGLQSHLRRFDSDPSLQKSALRLPDEVHDLATSDVGMKSMLRSRELLSYEMKVS